MFKVVTCITIALTGCASAGKGDDDAVTVDAPGKLIDAPESVSDCLSSDNCFGAMSLGTVSGDTGTQKLTAMGYQSAWFRVRVTEDNMGINGKPLRVSAQLTSPAGADFDVFVYLNAGNDLVECLGTVGTTSTTGTVNLTKAEWGEGGVPNGSNDSRDVSIEVRPVSGSCVSGQVWQLEVEGNWP